MLVELEKLNYGYQLKPIAVKNRIIIKKILAENDQDSRYSSIFYQEWENIPFDDLYLSKSQIKDLENGYDIRFRISLENYMALFGICIW